MRLSDALAEAFRSRPAALPGAAGIAILTWLGRLPAERPGADAGLLAATAMATRRGLLGRWSPSRVRERR